MGEPPGEARRPFQPLLMEPRFCPRCGKQLSLGKLEEEQRPRHLCEGCGYIYYVNPKVAAGTLPIREDGRVVLIRRGIPLGYGLWSFPCGYVELEETLEDAAIRETKEETNLDVEIEGLLGAYSYRGTKVTRRVVVIAYLARVTGGEAKPGDDAMEVGAFSADRIPWDQIAFLSARDALQEWLARRGKA